MLIQNNDSLDWLHHVRLFELNNTITCIGTELSEKRILEIGSGTGFQLKILKEYSSKAVGIDVKNSAHQEKVSQIILYDGQHIPFSDSSFDVVFSSNVLEHIKDINPFQGEIKRVLKTNGICIHILPSHYWRLWTSLFHYPWVFFFSMQIVSNFFTRYSNRSSTDDKKVVKGPHYVNRATSTYKTISLFKAFRTAIAPQRHGVRGNFITELFYFHPLWWEKNFTENGWLVVSIFRTGLFYWSHDLFRFKIPISYRQVLSKYLGSACYSYILRKEDFSEPVKITV